MGDRKKRQPGRNTKPPEFTGGEPSPRAPAKTARTAGRIEAEKAVTEVGERVAREEPPTGSEFDRTPPGFERD